MGRVLASTLIALVIGLVVGPRFIGWLRSRGIGQNIRELSPQSHTAKQGTPTMGGLLILGSALVPYVIFGRKTVLGLVVLLLVFGNGAIGLADDMLKQRRQRSLGPRGRRGRRRAPCWKSRKNQV